MKTPAGGLFRMTTITGLALLLFLSILPGCAARHMPDWSRVQAVPPKTKTEAQLYKDKASKGSRKVKGRFDSATTDSLTLRLKDGQTRTLEKSAVRKVLTHRPFSKRWPGWVALGVGLAASQMWGPLTGISSDHPNALFYIVHMAPAVPFFLLSELERIYEVPPQLRTRPAGGQQSDVEGKAPEKPEDHPRRD